MGLTPHLFTMLRESKVDYSSHKKQVVRAANDQTGHPLRTESFWPETALRSAEHTRSLYEIADLAV